ncbi:hypothetical protein FPQ18DRAFT_296815 [Pyronema domesticum]|uniref:Similar to CUE domain-containing protein 5 acc. no. O14319 n=1 Tax=Pyronema omphalodes (strain CBS 100304) TaxID=1076935 RepID=U4LYL4_PYROM|nr:hypothetical protein FPQ18DRAFT_296815 [Pyronema domesticum]CCX34948.1 Similar to CUE domain-containing protein 5; acc. no. O14319 [Pyronema omphalodes CBS 100304]
MSDKPAAEAPLAAVAAETPLPSSKPASPTPPRLSVDSAKAPTRPLSPQSQNQATLQEAFPNIDGAVIRAVLVASRGDLEPAFNALLSMSDPSAVEQPPAQPPRPAQKQPRLNPADFMVTSTPQSQLDADALYARQLQEHFGAPAPHAQDRRQQQPARRQRHPNDDSDEEYYHNDRDRPSFFDEDLPVIKENIKKGFIETQTKVTGWFNEFKKRIENEVSPETSPPGSSSGAGRSSGQYTRTGARRQPGAGGYGGGSGYDADHQVLSDDFTSLNLRDNTAAGTEAPKRQKANPALFKSDTRRVSFDDRPVTIEDDDLYNRPASRGPSPVAAGNSKWEPLKSVEAEPLNKDPFSLEDSDDEKDGLLKEEDVKEKPKTVGVQGTQETGVTK